MTEDQIWNMSDEDLEKMFLETRASQESPETDYENEMMEDMEQPVEDSDDDLVADEIEPETVEEASEEVDELDEVAEVEDEKTEDTEEDEIEEVAEVQKFKFKANGREYEFTEEEMRSQFPKVFGQAMDYTKKTQAMKPWRKTIDAIEQAKIGQDDINLMIDVLKGDKNAIAEVIKRAGVDALELDTENSKYVPKDYGRDETTLAIKDIVDEISNDKEYEITHRVLSKDWDEASFREMTKNPEMIKLLHIDVKSGEYDRIQTIAEKLKVFDRGRATDLEYYKMAAQEDARERYEANRRAEALEQQKIAREAKLARQAEVDRVRTAQQAREKTVEKVEQRKAAAPVRASAGTKKVVDYLDDSDEAFEDWYKQMEAKR